MSAVASGENRVRGRPGLRLRPPSRALGSLGMPRGGVGLTEVSGKGVEGFRVILKSRPLFPSP